jgi:hypothetical protein
MLSALKSVMLLLNNRLLELKERQQRYFEQVNEDPLLLKLNEIFADRILSGFSKDRLIELAKEGKRRYSANIPPGYEDAGKSEDGDPLRKFGDFFLWKELLEHIQQENKFLADSLEMWRSGTRFVQFDRIAINLLCTQSRFVRLLQCADFGHQLYYRPRERGKCLVPSDF